MSIENITARILREANDEAEQIISAARVEASEMLAEARNTAAEKVKAMEEKAVTDAAVLKERKASVAALEARKKVLAAKQEMIEECFSEAEKAFSRMPEEEYLEYLLSGLRGHSKGEVILSEKDRNAIGEKLAARLPEGLVLSEKTAHISGGFILQNGDISLNGSLETVLAACRKEMTGSIAGILFP